MNNMENSGPIEYPITAEKLNKYEAPRLYGFVRDIVTMIADYSNDTIELSYDHVRALHEDLGEVVKNLDKMKEDGNDED